MLDELGSYSLSDFLLFSQDTYYRLFELYNQEIWPSHVVAAVLGLLLLQLARKPSETNARAACAILSAAWAWVGWAFHIERYATINPWATYVGALFLVQALLVLLLGSLRRQSAGKPPGAVSQIGYAVVAFGILLQPLIGVLAGRTWAELSIFGMGPDPTATSTLGALLIFRYRGRWVLIVPPLLWCLISTLTAIAMDSVEGYGAAGAGLATLGAAVFGAVRARSAG